MTVLITDPVVVLVGGTPEHNLAAVDHW